MIVQGTTPTHAFKLPFAADLIKRVELSYVQNEKIVLSKDETAFTFDGNEITVTLSQEDTFLFDPQYFCTIELRVFAGGEKALNAKFKNVKVDKSYSKGVFTV